MKIVGYKLLFLILIKTGVAMGSREKELKIKSVHKSSLTRLKWSFRWMIFKEGVRRVVLFNLYRIRDFVFGLNFGRTIFLCSAGLVFVVGLTLLSRFNSGLDIPLVSLIDKGEIQYWGQVGDFFGGILNPLLSFMALMAVLYTIRLQRAELKEAREETRIANKIQDKQTEIFERQNFESVLFRLIDVHVKITERLMGQGGEQSVFRKLNNEALIVLREMDEAEPLEVPSGYGGNAVWFFTRQHKIRILSSAASEVLESRYANVLSHYYRNMYQLLKLIDGYKAGAQGEQDRAFRYFTCRQYSNMLRALLTNDELVMLALNCITKTGGGLKRYVEKYSLLKHLEFSGCLSGQELALEAYNELAFTDFEKIKPSSMHGLYN